MKYSIVPLFVASQLMSQLSAGQNNLGNYIHQGLMNNESLKQQQFVSDKQWYALQEAKSLFLPMVSFNSSYTLASGGRTVDIPVGDLVNPVYKTLNQLTASNSFPVLQNQRIQLNPDNYYDIKLHTTYPVINAELGYNRRIKSQQVDLQKTEINIFKRALAREIKIAFYKYIQSLEIIRIYETALLLGKENSRINASLFNNQKANRTALIRSDNEIIGISAKIKTANQNALNAKAYFNFLINRPLEAAIEIDSIQTIPDLAIVNDTSVGRREELEKLSIATAVNNTLVKLAGTYKVPKLNSFLDLGSQGFDFKVNNKSAYYFAGLSLEWNIFSGGRNKYRVKQFEVDTKVTQSQTVYVKQQLELEVKLAVNSFTAAVVNYQAAASQVEASEKYYRDLLRLYKEGVALFIELLDAQNQLIAARIQSNISLFDTWIKHTEIERATAGLIIK